VTESDAHLGRSTALLLANAASLLPCHAGAQCAASVSAVRGQRSALLCELPAYLVATAGVVIDHTESKQDHTFTKQVLGWWATNGSKFPAWAEAAQIVFAFTPNSAAAERVFSSLKAMFGDQQMETLADTCIIQTALMLRINERRVG